LKVIALAKLAGQTNEEIAIWEGHKYTKEEARETSGIKSLKFSNLKGTQSKELGAEDLERTDCI
jgi:hypothetical protein